ncbi:PDZ domain-containing protein [Bremerella cremea]|uniref:PDZ domain-containing protein n=1 Tax=Bremerella cremea TaxID=1031537 RepID=A0A368KJU5_9BACT|nr:trypsin-like peptidase domain-containing protein [Bremerella cremea]RCS41029.1 PDZ domain-containing protein [Bremerella cremea]
MPRFRLNLLFSFLVIAPLAGLVLVPAPAHAQIFESDGVAMRFMKRIHQRNSSEVLGAFHTVVGKARSATVELKRGDQQVAMGGVVDPNGLIVTKASLVNTYGDEAPLVVAMANGDQYLANEIVSIDKEHDLALVRIEAKNLPVMEIAADNKPAVGSILATAGLGEEPVAIGVCGLEPHKIDVKNAMLGVMLSQRPGPAVVDQVVEASAAATAGILAQDVILSINNTHIETGSHLIETVRTYEPGDSLRLTLRRAEEEMHLNVILGEWVAGRGQARHEFQNHLGGELSTRRSGFPAVFQHDSYLQPEQCGGPIVNLDGKVVGLNIARAGRVATYAIPGNELSNAVSKMLSAAGATRNSEIVQSHLSAKPVISENIDPPVVNPGWIPRETSK